MLPRYEPITGPIRAPLDWSAHPCWSEATCTLQLLPCPASREEKAVGDGAIDLGVGDLAWPQPTRLFLP